MFYKVLFQFSESVSGFNVFRYITFRTFLAFLTAFFICWFFVPYFIKKLNQRKMEENISEDGPPTHQKKQGTPTMGGGLVLLSLMVVALLWVDLLNPLVWATLAITFGFGAIGFWDDFLKSRSHKGQGGLSGRFRLVLEFFLSGAILSILVALGYLDPVLYFPFFKDISWDLSWFYVLFGSFVITGTANAVNLTDGLDGLAIVPVMICSGALGVFFLCGGTCRDCRLFGCP